MNETHNEMCFCAIEVFGEVCTYNCMSYMQRPDVCMRNSMSIGNTQDIVEILIAIQLRFLQYLPFSHQRESVKYHYRTNTTFEDLIIHCTCLVDVYRIHIQNQILL